MDIKTLDDINKLIVSDAETDSVEYKETTGQLERGMETLCAFLNKDGGTVLFGINDKKKVIGQEVADTTKRNIADAINRLEPAAAVQITYIPIPNSKKKVIVLHVEDSRRNRPFSYKGRPYMRVESVTSTMPQSKYNEFLLTREETRHGWETYPNPELKLSDLDEEEIRKTVRLGIESGRLPETTGNEIPGILEKLNILENGILNNAAEISVSFQTTYSYFFQIRYTVSVFVPCIFKPNSLFTFTGTEQICITILIARGYQLLQAKVLKIVGEIMKKLLTLGSSQLHSTVSPLKCSE